MGLGILVFLDVNFIVFLVNLVVFVVDFLNLFILICKEVLNLLYLLDVDMDDFICKFKVLI